MLLSLAMLWLLIFFINVIPALMPPTWIVLSFFFIKYNLPFLPTVILGVIAATSGRICLALMARNWFKDWLPKKLVTNYDDLGELLKKRQKLTIPVILAYAFSPVSSNSLFIMAGLSDLNLKIVAFSFFLGRLVSYTFWITASDKLSNRLEDIFAGSLKSYQTLISTAISLVIIVLVGKIKWKRFLPKN